MRPDTPTPVRGFARACQDGNHRPFTVWIGMPRIDAFQLLSRVVEIKSLRPSGGESDVRDTESAIGPQNSTGAATALLLSPLNLNLWKGVRMGGAPRYDSGIGRLLLGSE